MQGLYPEKIFLSRALGQDPRGGNDSRRATAGARLVEINARQDEALPAIDGLYLGGGFPDTNAEALAAHQNFRLSLKNVIEVGLPVYAECGGLMYLGSHLIVQKQGYPMIGTLPFTVWLEKPPQGHGYTVFTVDQANPYAPVGGTIRGHEIHYSRIIPEDQENLFLVFRLERGHGITGKRHGICYKNVLATYSHMHAPGSPTWAPALVAQARKHRNSWQHTYSPLSQPVPLFASVCGKSLT